MELNRRRHAVCSWEYREQHLESAVPLRRDFKSRCRPWEVAPRPQLQLSGLVSILVSGMRLSMSTM
jgi:hypothetical protein